jgi:hypothetical protein
MLLTDRFVYIHQPKTGGTFVTQSVVRLLEAHEPRSFLSRLFGRRTDDRVVDTSKHGTCGEIPESHRGLPVLASFRSPWSRYVSQYYYNPAWWRKHPAKHVDWDGIRLEFPTYPELSFADFVQLMNAHFERLEGSPLPPERRLGFQSRQFVRYFFRKPEESYRRLDDGAMEDRSFAKDMYPVKFLRQDRLNQDLHDSLVELGYDPADLGFILETGTVLPSLPRVQPRAEKHWSAHWTPELEEEIRLRERLLWRLFPEYEHFRDAPAESVE